MAKIISSIPVHEIKNRGEREVVEAARSVSKFGSLRSVSKSGRQLGGWRGGCGGAGSGAGWVAGAGGEGGAIRKFRISNIQVSFGFAKASTFAKATADKTADKTEDRG